MWQLFKSVIFKLILWIDILSHSCKLLSFKCHKTPLIVSHYWFRWWLGTVRGNADSQSLDKPMLICGPRLATISHYTTGYIYVIWAYGATRPPWVNDSGVWITKALFINLSVTKNSILKKYLVYYLNHIYIWQVPLQLTATHMSNKNVIFNSLYVYKRCKNRKTDNNGTEEIALVLPPPPPPPPHHHHHHHQYVVITAAADYWLPNSSTLVPHICVSESGQHWFRYWLVAYSAPMLDYYQLDPWEQASAKVYHYTQLCIHKNASENIVCEMVAILSRWWRFCPGRDDLRSL